MASPTYPHFFVGAALGACAGTWARIFGGLVLNGLLDLPNFNHFLFNSLVAPKLALYAFTLYVVVGTPLFLWARRRNRLNLWLFVGTGTFVGYLASYPALLIAPWAAVYTFAGLISALVGYSVMQALVTYASERLGTAS